MIISMNEQPVSIPRIKKTGRPSVLVVDDYPENCRLLYFYLRSDYDVSAVFSAEEAFTVLEEQDIDLLIMDINLKTGMSGLEATKIIRQDPRYADLPILAISAYAYPDDKARFLEAGFNDYVPKPIFKTRILQKVRSLLGDGKGVWVTGPRGPEAA